ncbi:MAG TPA: 8-amino-7-oxononanoate synthase [Nitrospirales bacterium]|nr:8-amino-7-oxononanoate synthase [Nitrospirales bacterium]
MHSSPFRKLQIASSKQSCYYVIASKACQATTIRQKMFTQSLTHLQETHLLRTLHRTESEQDAEVTIAGKTVILFSSNNYLGLANHPKLKEAAIAAIKQYGFGAGASRLLSGTMSLHERLETRLASFAQTAAALTFSSGYHANIGLIQTLTQELQPHCLVLADRACHASLIDAIRLTKARFKVYQHQNTEQLERLLSTQAVTDAKNILVVTEGVFSMDGDIAPLPQLLTCAKKCSATLLVDDAHGTGVMGRTGRGTIEHFDLETKIPIRMGTLGKALGCMGGFVAGPRELIQLLINRARSFIYTTAPPPAIAAAALAALSILEAEPERRDQLWQNRDYMLSNLKSLGYNTMHTESPILPILIGDPSRTLQFSQQLFEHGIYAPAIRPPTIPRGTSRLRISIMATHQQAQLDYALDVFRNVGRSLGIIS